MDRAIAIAIVIGALVIGASLLLGNRYSLVAGTNGAVWRIDHLTGRIDMCERGDFNPFCGTVAEPERIIPKSRPAKP